ncbi:hypothetical protein CH063_03722 [Colletotrichum higginsianum]|uniref:Uncharacterized protein n=2 Tax=Colletotrichum higginsianum TaxID=80884 RepID=H1W081_COLHI|nr:hypothetical protein CH63R_07005 [Colletotrichum higginsianum IMI 349063]OBR08240.1 hypothetical protein CH63R_07005 [Colletotrichum higginsianum IMI 349063]TIC89531.1 hypothetical protein CH35J_012787 [Colletotrichum higginsianum]CCF45893.1 hypothetical protein CH063_03722 [Colletotrichum higginsianum]
MDPHNHPQSLTPLRHQTDRETGNIWEESIYRMYGDIKTPKEPPPPPPPPANPKHQPQLGFEQPEEDEADDSFDEGVSWHPGPQLEPQWPRYSRPPQFRAGAIGAETSGPAPRSAVEPAAQQHNGKGNYWRLHVSVDVGGGGDSGRSWLWSTNGRVGLNINFGTPFANAADPLISLR